MEMNLYNLMEFTAIFKTEVSNVYFWYKNVEHDIIGTQTPVLCLQDGKYLRHWGLFTTITMMLISRCVTGKSNIRRNDVAQLIRDARLWAIVSINWRGLFGHRWGINMFRPHQWHTRDNFMPWIFFLRYWPFVEGIHRSLVMHRLDIFFFASSSCWTNSCVASDCRLHNTYAMFL